MKDKYTGIGIDYYKIKTGRYKCLWKFIITPENGIIQRLSMAKDILFKGRIKFAFDYDTINRISNSIKESE